MARAALAWSTTELASKAGVGSNTVNRFEAGQDARVSSVDKMRAALEAAGVIFVAENGEGPGVRLRKAPASQAATEADMQASAAVVRAKAADAVDEALSGSSATTEEKAERRGALTDEPAVIGKARGKGAGARLRKDRA